MWIFRCLTCATIAVTSVANSVPAVVEGELGKRLDVYLAELAQKGSSGAFLVAKEGEVILAKGYGEANRKTKVPVAVDTVFDIGSITKQFTAAAILKLEMDRKLSTDDLVSTYFDGVFEGRNSTTIHHLLTHTAALPESLGGDYKPLGRDELVRKALSTRPKWPVGEKYYYSNTGYSLLAAIIEKVSGQSYEAYLREQLFLPAGMTDTGYLLPDWESARVARGYQGRKDWGTPLEHRWDTDGPYWNLRGNGGILSTVEDMYAWRLALDGTVVLSEDAKGKLFAPHVVEEEGGSVYYAYGWVWAKTSRDTTLITHNGGNDVFFADFRWYVEDEVFYVFMTNAEKTVTAEHQRAFRGILFGD